MYPSLFISHGAPSIVLGENRTKNNIRAFSKTLPKPKYIIIISAHYVSEKLMINDFSDSELLYDFYGFPEELYDYEYEIPVDKTYSMNVYNHLKNNGLDIGIEEGKTYFDHGVWTTLDLMYKKLDIPVVQISLPLGLSIDEYLKLGIALQSFKNEAMIIGTGGLTHNLRDVDFNGGVKEYAKVFNDDMVKTVLSGNEQEVKASVKHKYFAYNHPTTEHYMPFVIAFGSAKNKKGKSFNSEILHSNISMECFAFDV
jgi:4,5-DOPA dioxygenase extradiol